MAYPDKHCTYELVWLRRNRWHAKWTSHYEISHECVMCCDLIASRDYEISQVSRSKGALVSHVHTTFFSLLKFLKLWRWKPQFWILLPHLFALQFQHQASNISFPPPPSIKIAVKSKILASVLIKSIIYQCCPIVVW